MKYIMLFLLLFLMGSNVCAANIEMLVKTSDNFATTNYLSPTLEQTLVMCAGNYRQGYIVTMRPEGYQWGRLERDPKRFMIVRIPEDDWESAWVSSSSTYRRIRRLPLENVLSPQALADLRAIPYNTPSEQLTPIVVDVPVGIDTKIVDVVWNSLPAPIILHGSAGTFNIRIAGSTDPVPDYTTLSTWEAGEQCDLTAGGGLGLCEAKCYNDWPAGMNNSVLILGWTTDANNYVRIYAPEEQRHNGVALNAAGNASGFMMLNTVAASCIESRTSYTRVEYIVVDGNNHAYDGIRIQNADYNVINSCIAFDCVGYNICGITLVSATQTRYSRIINCLTYGCTVGFKLYADGAGHSHAYCLIANNTGYGNNDFGFEFGEKSGGADDYTIYYNNLIDNTTSYDYKVYTKDATAIYGYNASGDATASVGGGVGNRIRQTFTWRESGLANDRRLSKLDLGACDYGIDLSNNSYFPFSYDAEGDLRRGSWDIGFDEVIGRRRFMAYWGL